MDETDMDGTFGRRAMVIRALRRIQALGVALDTIQMRCCRRRTAGRAREVEEALNEIYNGDATDIEAAARYAPELVREIETQARETVARWPREEATHDPA